MKVRSGVHKYILLCMFSSELVRSHKVAVQTLDTMADDVEGQDPAQEPSVEPHQPPADANADLQEKNKALQDENKALQDEVRRLERDVSNIIDEINDAYAQGYDDGWNRRDSPLFDDEEEEEEQEEEEQAPRPKISLHELTAGAAKYRCMREDEKLELTGFLAISAVKSEEIGPDIWYFGYLWVILRSKFNSNIYKARN
eukprot:SAG22_NODE_485_length_9905_cov_35.562003_4_plen_199_part_00